MAILLRIIRKALRQEEALPDSMTCPDCHWEMSFVSIEMGYTCRNPRCKLHVGQEVLA
jgi:uncharacterized paraquat-inducible protein A